MKVKIVDLVEAATDNVFEWFGACETPDDCHALASELRETIDSVAASHAERLSRDDATRLNPLRARPSEDGEGLPQVPFAACRDPREPLYTFDCSWCCGVDLLRAEKEAVGRTTLPFRDFPRRFTSQVGATVYRVDDETPDGLRLHGHVAVADYHGGWLVWLADDLVCSPSEDGSRHEVTYFWTADGNGERCEATRAECYGEACYHCSRPIEGAAVRLEATDGDSYLLHPECAREGCDGPDTETIDAVLAGGRAEDDAPGPEPRATLGEEVAVVPVGGDLSGATVLREANGTRRWVPCGEPEENWWVALGESGERLPGDWEYDRGAGTVVCSLL